MFIQRSEFILTFSCMHVLILLLSRKAINHTIHVDELKKMYVKYLCVCVCVCVCYRMIQINRPHLHHVITTYH